MPLQKILDTTIHGNEGLCDQAAEFLEQTAQAADGALGDVARGRSTAESSWEGPAHNEFAEKTSTAKDQIQPLADAARKASGGLRDFSTGLKTLKSMAKDIRQQAQAGGLEVVGPFIIAPTEPANAPQCDINVKPSQEASQAGQEHKAEVDAYNAQVDAYNQKLKNYNARMQQVYDLRNAEQQDHLELQEALTDLSEATHTAGSTTGYAFTAVGQANNVLQFAEGRRREAATWRERLNGAGRVSQHLAEGGWVPDKNGREWLERWKSVETDQGVVQQRLQDGSGIMRKVGQQVLHTSSAYPFRGDVESLATHSSTNMASAGKVLKGLSVAGAGITMGSELYQSWEGRQSWGMGVYKGAEEVGGGAVAGAVGGGALGAVAGPPGALVGGAVGGFAGATGVGGLIDDYRDHVKDECDRIEYWSPIPEKSHMKYNY